MAYDELLADRIRDLLAARTDLSERKMFGGICFMAGENMVAGVTGDELMLRLGKEDGDRAVAGHQNVRPFEMSGQRLKNFVLVDPVELESDESLEDWLDQAMEFVSGL